MPDEYEILRTFLTDRPIAFHPMLARALGGVNEALIVQQLAFWSDKGYSEDGWIYKTQAQFREETTLTRDQQERARKRLRTLGVIAEERRGIPAKLYFRVNWGALFARLGEAAIAPQPRMRETRTLDGGKGTDQSAGFPPSFQREETETTPERPDLDDEETIFDPAEARRQIALLRKWHGE